MTVVDGASFLDELHAIEELRDRGWDVSDDDNRTVAQLFCDQLDFANVIVMNKIDLLDDAGRARLRAMLRRFNPSAQIVEAAWGRVDPGRLLGTGLFDMGQAERHPDWLREARDGEHTPETVEYGISSIVFRSQRPFSVQRFEELTADMERRDLLIKNEVGDMKKEEEEEGEEASLPTMSSSEARRKVAGCVIRSKGLVWLATQQSHWQQGTANLAGRRFTISYGVPWAAAVEGASKPQDEKTDFWQEPWGDRRTELVVIGQSMDHAAMTAALEACVLTDNEMDEYQHMFADAKPLDVLSTKGVGMSNEELAERLKRFEIEILAPKKKKTQVLRAAPISTTPVSAHACIAIYEGGTRFRMERYLRYAHLFPELASGLVKEFSLPVDAMDAQTALLADQTSGGSTLSGMLQHLNCGDKVELEWLQIRVEMETDVAEDRYSVVEQCQKLSKLEDGEEEALLKLYPQPQIMIRKDRMPTPSCNTEIQQRKENKEKKLKNGKKRGKKKGKKRS